MNDKLVAKLIALAQLLVDIIHLLLKLWPF